MNVLRKKGQGTFEYILLLAGILLIVVIAIVLLRGGLFETQASNVEKNNCRSALALSSTCYYPVNRSWNPFGTVTAANAEACTLILPTLTPGACTSTSTVGSQSSAGVFCCAAQV